jgi:PAS domain S-box-containing protein
VQDVTSQRVAEGELRRSEENFRRLVTAVREYAIFMLDATGTVVSWNAGAQRIKGYAGHEIIGRHFRVFYPLEDQVTGHPGHNLEMALRHGSYAEEGWRVRQDGSRFWASVLITAVYDDAGRHVGFAKVTRDLTQQRVHEEERQRFIDERVHLLALTAHELRNPTAVIDRAAGALLAAWDGLSVDERTELLDSIRSSADRLRRLAADLSGASRSEGDTLSLQLEHVSLTEALRTAAARHDTGVGVPIAVDTPREAVFLADAERLGQAIDNLIDNAIRHGTPPVGVVGTANDEVCIRVTDAGSGVPADLTPHLFQRLASGGATGGTGLGLYLVREIARRHGGDATYHPPVGDEPPAFEIRIPRRY